MSKKSKHSQEFRDTAVQLALKGDKPVAQVAKELGIDKHLLYSWIKSWKEKHESAGPRSNQKQPSSVDEELKELRRKNKQLELENEILKKAAA